MSAHHFFVPSVSADRIEITGEDARHAVRVLRIVPGERITISDGLGTVVTAEVTDAGSTMVASVVERTTVEHPRPSIAVFQALPKSGKLDAIVQDLTEAGVDRIVPLRARRSIPRWDAGKAATHVVRWQTIARESSMQSRRAWLPEVRDITGEVPEGAFVLHEEATLRLTAALPGSPPDEVALASGPEGGFEPAEIAAFSSRGCRIVSLGPSVLRTETAALVAAVVVLSRYGRIG